MLDFEFSSVNIVRHLKKEKSVPMRERHRRQLS